jgi:hypothetical protein
LSDRTPLTELEKRLVRKLAGASFPPATASKRFARDLGSGYVTQLSDRGRRFLAFVVHRFRRQYKLEPDESAWLETWLEPPAPPELPEEHAAAAFLDPAELKPETKPAIPETKAPELETLPLFSETKEAKR